MSRSPAVFVLLLLATLPTVRHRNLGDCGGSSRLATAEALVERGSFAIDGGSFEWTCDVMIRDGRLYSDKPPLLSVIAAGVYAFVHHVLGRRFDPAALPLGPDPPHDHTYLLMTALVVGMAQAALGAAFDAELGRRGVAPGMRIGALLSLIFATLLWPLASLFNSHTVAALFIFVGLCAAERGAHPGRAGLALGLAAAVDLPLGGLALALGLWLGRSRRLALVLGSLVPLAAHALLNWWIVGDLVPFQLHRELYTAATGHTGESATGFAQDAGAAFYAWRNLFGALGVFSLTPLLLLAVPLAARAAWQGERLARAALALFVVALGLYVAIWPEAVGCSYGMRHVTPALAPLLLVAVGVVSTSGLRRAWALLALLSALLAAGGVLQPATCAGFVGDARGYVPARVFFVNLREVLFR